MEHRIAIEAWMSECVHGGGIGRFDELHIDRIDAAWREPLTWISASLEVLKLATSIKDAAPYCELSVALALSLQPTTQRTGVDFSSMGGLQKSLGHTPPSLYLFREGNEPWIEPKVEDVTVEKVDVSMFGPLRPKQCFYREFKEAGEDEYYRSVFLVE